MKRISSVRRNRSLAGVSAPAAIVVFAILFVFVLARIFFPSVLLAAEAPFLHASAYLDNGLGNLLSGFDNARSLASERALLVAQNETLTQENAVLSAKVADLSTLVGTVPNPAPGLAAGVLARPPVSPYDTLSIAAGKDDGIVVGDSAYSAGGIPIGMVENVSGSAAQVELLSASGVKTQAWLGSQRTAITLLGEGGGSFSAQAPRSASSTGEEIYVAGAGSLPIGVVSGTGGDPSAPFSTLYIKGVVNPFSITYVLIRPVSAL